jgi:hypothetical protein
LDNGGGGAGGNGGGVSGICVAGECVEDDLCTFVICDNFNQCTVGECDPATGECVPDPYPRDGWPCDGLGIGDGICMLGECVIEP